MIDLTESTFLLFASKHYENSQCLDFDEFLDDLNRFKYIKRLFSRYKETGKIKERLVLNHLIVLYNVFGVEAATRMLFFKIDEHVYLKSFLIFLNYMPDVIYGINGKNIVSADIPVDINITRRLREI